jgi:hypothetical protein
VFGAVTRIVIASSFFFTRFSLVHDSPFSTWWQAYDFPFRAAQSLLQHHTRTQNALALAFGEILLDATKHRREALVDAMKGDDGGAVGQGACAHPPTLNPSSCMHILWK